MTARELKQNVIEWVVVGFWVALLAFLFAFALASTTNGGIEWL